MRLGQEIEKIRKEQGLSIVYMCNIFNTDERGYKLIATGLRRPDVFSLIMFIDVTRCCLNSLITCK